MTANFTDGHAQQSSIRFEFKLDYSLCACKHMWGLVAELLFFAFTVPYLANVAVG